MSPPRSLPTCSDRMPKLPLPPPELPPLQTADLLTWTPTDHALARVYFRSGAHPSTWSAFRYEGPLTTARYDHHLPVPGQGQRGILYAAAARTSDAQAAAPIAACLAEVFQATRLVDRFDREPWLVIFELAASVRLLDLTGAWPTRAGASQKLSTGRHDYARAWSRRIYEQYDEVDGLLYPSAMYGGGSASALYERAEPALAGDPLAHMPLAHPGLRDPLRRITAHIGYRLR